MTAVSDIKQLKEGAASMQERDKNTQGRTPHTHTHTHMQREKESESIRTCTCTYLQSFGPLSLGGDISL